MRILLVNKFYYPRGGDCVCMMNLETLLKRHGVDVAVYAMQYSENVDSAYSSYFASNVDFSGGASQKVAALRRTLGCGDIVSSFNKILNDFNPDVVHLHNIHSYLSPVIGRLAKKHGCRVVWTLHDYKLLCPTYNCLCNGEVCEACFVDKAAVLKRRCMKGSLSASVVAYMESLKWNRKALEAFTDVYICPSQFMAQKMAEGGFNRHKLINICNPVDTEKLNTFMRQQVVERDSYYTYIGRLSEEKGVELLLKTASQLPYHLKVAGTGPLADTLREQYKDCKNIEFLGHLDAGRVSSLLTSAQFSIIPSEWYENNPLSVIESLCAGTPVVGTDMGGIPELLSEQNGIVFPAKNGSQMAAAIQKAFDKTWSHEAIKQCAVERFSSEKYWQDIKGIYGL